LAPSSLSVGRDDATSGQPLRHAPPAEASASASAARAISARAVVAACPRQRDSRLNAAGHESHRPTAAPCRGPAQQSLEVGLRASNLGRRPFARAHWRERGHPLPGSVEQGQSRSW
jgi:hypothetical protein